MKFCPTCKRTFEDDLKFCLDDGTLLAQTASDPKATAQFSNQQTFGNRSATNDPFNQHSSQPPVKDSYGSTPFAQGHSKPTPYAKRENVFVPITSLFLSIVSGFLGLFSITFGLIICMGFFTAPIAVIVGLAALVKIKLDWSKCANKVMPVISLILSSIGILTGGFVFIGFLIYFLLQFM